MFPKQITDLLTANDMVYPHLSAMKRDKLLTHITLWINLKNRKPDKRSPYFMIPSKGMHRKANLWRRTVD